MISTAFYPNKFCKKISQKVSTFAKKYVILQYEKYHG